MKLQCLFCDGKGTYASIINGQPVQCHVCNGTKVAPHILYDEETTLEEALKRCYLQMKKHEQERTGW